MMDNMLLLNLLFTTSFVFNIQYPVTLGYTVPNYRYLVQVDHNKADGGSDFKPPLEPTINKNYWHEQALNTLKKKIGTHNEKFAKNIIFFLGDGMGIPTLTAARIYQGQLKNKSGEEETLFFENFPSAGLSKTYCIDAQVADSACTATAFMTGVKTNFLTIGVTSNVTFANCQAAKAPEMRPSSLIQWAQDAGKGTGIITTARITHATPAGAYAHVPDRDMECDGDVVKKKLDKTVCNYDIAKQLIFDEPGKNVKVILGGGRTKFIPENEKDPVTSHPGERQDKQNLIEQWKNDKRNRSAKAAVAYTAAELKNVSEDTEYLLGLFENDHLKYHADSDAETDVTLAGMTEKAIQLLKKEKNGFVLFVEGGKIDMAHHEGFAQIALDETIEFAKAIETAHNMTDVEDTLIVVTADHSHVMTMSGYPNRGNNILKFAGTDKDHLPYYTLSYANGPGYHKEVDGNPYNLTSDNSTDPHYRFPSMVNLTAETHGGEDVAVYASGPWSHLFTGNYEQNYIPIAEAFAANIGPAKDILKSAAFSHSSYFASILCLMWTIYYTSIFKL